MGRLPKKIDTNVSPKFPFKIWAWIGGGLILMGLFAWYNAYKFQPPMCFKKPTPIVNEPVDFTAQMEEPTTQDLQALPIAQETAEEAMVIADFQNDELIQVFEEQEQRSTKTDSKPKAPVVVKRSLGLV